MITSSSIWSSLRSFSHYFLVVAMNYISLIHFRTGIPILVVVINFCGCINAATMVIGLTNFTKGACLLFFLLLAWSRVVVELGRSKSSLKWLLPGFTKIFRKLLSSLVLRLLQSALLAKQIYSVVQRSFQHCWFAKWPFCTTRSFLIYLFATHTGKCLKKIQLWLPQKAGIL